MVTQVVFSKRHEFIFGFCAGHPFHTEGLTCLAISNDSTIALTGSTDNNACIVNIQTGRVSLSDKSNGGMCVFIRLLC